MLKLFIKLKMKIFKLIFEKCRKIFFNRTKNFDQIFYSNNIQIIEHKLSELRILDFLKKNKICTLVDIGASNGDFIMLTKAIHPKSIIHAFEPIPAVYETLKDRFKEFNDVFCYNSALGKIEGVIDFYENEYSQSSSILRMAKSHINEFPFTKNTVIKKISIKKLDELFSQNKLEKPLLLKIDVQGYESEVILGGREIILQADYIIIEVSFCELYTGQALFDEVNKQLVELGFVYSGNVYQIISKETGRVLQADALYHKMK